MTLTKTLSLGLLGLCAVLALETYTDIDIYLQNLCFNYEAHEWQINPMRHKQLTIFFYNGLKRTLLIFAIACLFNLILSVKLTNLRCNNHFCLIMLLSFILIPTLIAGAKYFTNVYCPYQLNMYNGLYPFVRVLESYPSDFIQPKAGRCFPAGHATAGFAFLGLYYAFRSKPLRIMGLCIGLSLGWIAGIYQMLRGQHFLSHTLFSMVAALTLIVVINYLVLKIEKKFPHLLKSQ
ncbi:MAG: phosphatase PAP2 family protein [Alphaproteobacteria bacterium]|nr:phosphatase PAP2 family protein [Alphaproteobacteria bacterium]